MGNLKETVYIFKIKHIIYYFIDVWNRIDKRLYSQQQIYVTATTSYVADLPAPER